MPAKSKPAGNPQGQQPNKEIDGALKTLARGSAIVLVGLTLSKFITYLWTLVIARSSPQLLGAFSIGSSFLSIGEAIAGLGIPYGLYRLIPEYNSHNDTGKLKSLVSTSIIAGLAVGIALCAALFLSSNWIATRFFPNEPGLALSLEIFAVGIPIMALLDIIGAVMHGFKHVEIEAISRFIAENILKLAAISVAVYAGTGILGLSAAYVIAEIASLILAVYLVEKYVFPVTRLSGGNNAETSGRLFYYSLPILLSQPFNTLLASADTLFLGHYRTALETGIYNAAAPTALIMLLAPGIVAKLNPQVLVELKEKGLKEEMSKVYSSVAKWIFYLNFPLFLYLSLFAGQVLSVLYGKVYAAGATALVILCLGNLVFTVGAGASDALAVFDRPRLVFWNTVAAAIIAVILNYILVPAYGMNGAAVAMGVALAAYAIFAQVEVYAIAGFQPYTPEYLKALVAGAVAIGLTFFASKAIYGSMPLWALAILSIAYGLVYLLALFLLKSFDSTDIMLIKAAEHKYGIRQLAPLRKMAREYYYGKRMNS